MTDFGLKIEHKIHKLNANSVRQNSQKLGPVLCFLFCRKASAQKLKCSFVGSVFFLTFSLIHSSLLAAAAAVLFLMTKMRLSERHIASIYGRAWASSHLYSYKCKDTKKAWGLQENPQKPEKKVRARGAKTFVGVCADYTQSARSMRTDIVHGRRFTPKLVAMKK